MSRQMSSTYRSPTGTSGPSSAFYERDLRLRIVRKMRPMFAIILSVSILTSSRGIGSWSTSFWMMFADPRMIVSGLFTSCAIPTATCPRETIAAPVLEALDVDEGMDALAPGAGGVLDHVAPPSRGQEVDDEPLPFQVRVDRPERAPDDVRVKVERRLVHEVDRPRRIDEGHEARDRVDDLLQALLFGEHTELRPEEVAELAVGGGEARIAEQEKEENDDDVEAVSADVVSDVGSKEPGRGRDGEHQVGAPRGGQRVRRGGDEGREDQERVGRLPGMSAVVPDHVEKVEAQAEPMTARATRLSPRALVSFRR